MPYWAVIVLFYYCRAKKCVYCTITAGQRSVYCTLCWAQAMYCPGLLITENAIFSLVCFLQYALGKVIATTKSSTGLPQSGDEYDFYRSYPGFRSFCETQGDRLLHWYVITVCWRHRGLMRMCSLLTLTLKVFFIFGLLGTAKNTRLSFDRLFLL